MSLDDTLAAWAATVALPDNTADAIYRRIVPTELPASWWRDYTAEFTAQMVRSMRPVKWSFAA